MTDGCLIHYGKACPKHEKEKLSDKEKREIKQQLFIREKGLCQGCGDWFPMVVENHMGIMVFDEFKCGHFSHIKSKGAGGRYTLDNGMYHCFKCHRNWEDHTGRFKDR